MFGFDSIDSETTGAQRLRDRAYGVIQTSGGQLEQIVFRPWPKEISILGAWWTGRRLHRQKSGDRCLLFYNQPRHLPNYLTLKYVVSHRETSFATIRAAFQALDRIAQLKQTDAIVCDVTNVRISDRLLDREGWVRHVPGSRRRHFIKRFYGEYPV